MSILELDDLSDDSGSPASYHMTLKSLFYIGVSGDAHARCKRPSKTNSLV